MRRVWLLWSLALLILTSACGGTPALPEEEDALETLGSVLDWDRSPAAVVVRLELLGRSGDLVSDLNRLPFCTLFGDGHLVWTSTGVQPQQVLEDRLPEEQARDFIQYVIGSGFYSWEQGGELIPPTPVTGETTIVQAITVSLYGQTRTLDAFSNWPPHAFERLVEHCRTLSSTPVLYEPQGVWLSIVPAHPQADMAVVTWEAEAAAAFPDFDPVTATLDSPRWVTGPLAVWVWRIAREGGMGLMVGATPYELIVQDPAIQSDAPPAPPTSGT